VYDRHERTATGFIGWIGAERIQAFGTYMGSLNRPEQINSGETRYAFIPLWVKQRKWWT
jgi:hypothetical protein